MCLYSYHNHYQLKKSKGRKVGKNSTHTQQTTEAEIQLQYTGE